MKKLYTFLALLLIAAYSFSQAPPSFNYQAVVRDGSGEIQANLSVAVIVSILKGSVDGTEVFNETHNGTTTDFGLINLVIGSVNTTDFPNINWSSGPFFLKVNINGDLIGTTQLLSVPYAIYASQTRIPELTELADVDVEGISSNEILYYDGASFKSAKFSFYYEDKDDDSFGNPDKVIYSPFKPDSFVENANDCNDNESTAYSGAIDLCDGIDNNCDGVDGEDESWYNTPCDGSDIDLCMEGVLICDGGVMFCTDTTGDSIELCNGIDDDCDGEIDEGGTCTCSDDHLEHNDIPEEASLLSIPVIDLSLSLCSADDDWFVFDVATEQTISINVLFNHSEGNIDIHLYDDSLNLITSSKTSDDVETIEYLTSGGTNNFYLEVRFYEDSGSSESVQYDLSINLN